MPAGGRPPVMVASLPGDSVEHPIAPAWLR
jgi:hypothetical protein